MHYMCSAPKLQCTKYEPNRALSSQPRSTEIQPFGATGATYGHKCAFYGIFGPFLTPLEVGVNDTPVFLLNEYVVELNPANFNILNQILN